MDIRRLQKPTEKLYKTYKTGMTAHGTMPENRPTVPQPAGFRDGVHRGIDIHIGKTDPAGIAQAGSAYMGISGIRNDSSAPF
jgi:hypothetical protein